MLHNLTDEARAAIADQRAKIADAQAKAETFARDEMDPVAARHVALRQEHQRLGAPPALDAYVTAADWRQATDQHTFDSRYYEREAAAMEDKLNALRDQHQSLLAEVLPLRQQLQRMALDALHDAIQHRTKEAAEIANVRQSFLNRIPLEQHRFVVSETSRADAQYGVRSSGWPDMSIFEASAQCSGFTADKSAALVAELGLS